MFTAAKLKHKMRLDTSTRIHIMILYVLLACVTIAWTIYVVHISRTMRVSLKEMHLIKQRLHALESNLVTITTPSDAYDDAVPRQSRNTRVPLRSSNAAADHEPHQSDILLGSIHFKVPVRETPISKLAHRDRAFVLANGIDGFLREIRRSLHEIRDEQRRSLDHRILALRER